jgi:hypothetical protein
MLKHYINILLLKVDNHLCKWALKDLKKKSKKYSSNTNTIDYETLTNYKAKLGILLSH